LIQEACSYNAFLAPGSIEEEVHFLEGFLSFYNIMGTKDKEKESMTKRLCRLQSSKMIGGVCAGIAWYFDLDVSLIRLIFVGIALITALFPMLLFYIIAWIIIPTEEEVTKKKKERKSSERHQNQ